MSENKRVKGVRFEPELLARIEKDAATLGEDFSTWIRVACEARLGHARSTARPRAAKDVVQTKPQPFDQARPVAAVPAPARAPGATARQTARQHAENCGCLSCQLKKVKPKHARTKK